MNMILNVSSLANVEGVKTGVGDALPHLLGFVLVLITLMALWGLCELMGKLLKGKYENLAIPVESPPPASISADRGKLTNEEVAVVAAAVTAVLGEHHRVISIQESKK